jgi:hypothetical protein
MGNGARQHLIFSRDGFSRLLTLRLFVNQYMMFERFLDTSYSQGTLSLLDAAVFAPPVHPRLIDDPNDKKPTVWDERRYASDDADPNLPRAQSKR